MIGALLVGSLLGTGFAAALPATASSTQELRVYATDDAYTSSVRKTVNFGAADKLVVGRASGETRVSYVKFTVGKLPAGTSLAGAELRLPAASKPAPGTLTASQMTNTVWTQQRITAAGAPGPGVTVASVRTSATDTVVRLNLDKVVTKPGVYSFAIKSSAADISRFRSREFGSSASGGPELRLTLRKISSTPGSITPAPTTPAPTTPAPTTPAPSPTTPAPTTPAPTSPAPTTPAPTTPAPTTPAPTTPAPTTPAECKVDALLVPSCGVLWGAAAGGFSDVPRDQAHKDWEALSGRTATIFHGYHRGDQLFPTKAQIALTRDPAKPRVLLLNWKVAYGSTWAEVAAGKQDARIDRWIAYVKANYTEKFFLALHHEPENDVIATAGSGMTAKDYAAMYRYVITRMKAQGLTNVVNVVAYMGNAKWLTQPWWGDIYPGDDVVDWIGLDSYLNAQKGGFHYGMFADLLDRGKAQGNGFYDWAAKRNKPIMLAEWGVYHSTTTTLDKSAQYDSVLPELKKRPAIKALVYFDTEADDEGDRNIHIASTPANLESFRKLASDPIFNVKLR